MTQAQAHTHSQAIKRTLIEIVLPAIGFGLGVGFATQDYAASLVTGLAISGTIYVVYQLDLAFLRPRLEMLSRDWVRVGLEMALSLFEHLLGSMETRLLPRRSL